MRTLQRPCPVRRSPRPPAPCPLPRSDKDIAVWGKWIDQYNSKLTITNDAFDTQYSDYLSDPPTYTNPASRIAITFYDNDGTVANLGALGQTGFLVGQNAGGSFPDLWSRMDWHRDATGLKYCTTAYNAADEQTAMLQLVLHPASHDRANTTHGCGGFPFSVLSPRTGA